MRWLFNVLCLYCEVLTFIIIMCFALYTTATSSSSIIISLFQSNFNPKLQLAWLSSTLYSVQLSDCFASRTTLLLLEQFHDQNIVWTIQIHSDTHTRSLVCTFNNWHRPLGIILTSMATEWSLDFCLVCDCQTLGGPYCSQTCRLTELDLLPSETRTSSSAASSTYSIVREQSNLPTPSCSIDPNMAIARSSQPAMQILSPSTSQTSLSSVESNSSQGSTVPDRFQTELRDYANCFDQVRDLKRRLASS